MRANKVPSHRAGRQARAAATIGEVTSQMASPLNVLFITADQWRGDCLSALGHPVVRTPNLDALAADGVLFRRHFANAAPCGPSRASLHTGMYLQNHRSGTNGTPLDARHTNWAREAAARGYDPVLFGYTDTSQDPRGLDADDPWLKSYEGPLPGIRPLCLMTWDTDAVDRLAQGSRFRSARDIRFAYGNRDPGPGLRRRRAASKAAHVSGGVRRHRIPGRQDDRLHYASASGPFVAHLSLLRPHPPFVAPEPYNSMYDPCDWCRASRASRRPKTRPASIHGSRISWPVELFRATDNEKRLRRLKAVYYGLMSRVDAEIGG